MPHWLIVVLIVLLVLLGLVFLPLRLVAAGGLERTADLKVMLKIGHLVRVKILTVEDKSLRPDVRAWRQKHKERAEKKDGKSKEKKDKALIIVKEDIPGLIRESLARLQIEQVDIRANLAGDPFHSSQIAAALWQLFGIGLGWLSHRVRRFTAEPRLDFAVDIRRPWSLSGELVLMIRLGAVLGLGIKVLAVILKNRRNAKKEKKEISLPAAA